MEKALIEYTRAVPVTAMVSYMKCQVTGCGCPGVAKNLCAKHYKRQQRHGHLLSTRPDDWGKREKHEMYGSWNWIIRRAKHGMESVWRDDFWKFVDDVGERPSEKHTMRRFDDTKPYGPDNFFWKERLASSKVRKDYAKAWRESHPTASKSMELKRAFGITLDDYMRMLESQGGVCAICKGPQIERYEYFSVDHCHDTGQVRGLLCSSCNGGLGFFSDKPDLLDSAAAYLRSFGTGGLETAHPS